jgi:outer membrane protein assembly factor BamD
VVIHSRSRLRAARLGVVALASLTFLTGCGLFRSRPDTVPPVAALYAEGESDLAKGRHEAARDSFRKVLERHPDSGLVPQARFLLGESFYREHEYDRAVREFEAFMAYYPAHPIADLAQYRLARSHFDNMPPLERDQAVTARALGEFRKLLKQYPESRYAPDAVARMEVCRLRLAQKELWVAEYYVRQGNYQAALQRYDVILKEYSRTAAAPQALFQKADALTRLGRPDEAQPARRRVVD